MEKAKKLEIKNNDFFHFFDDYVSNQCIIYVFFEAKIISEQKDFILDQCDAGR